MCVGKRRGREVRGVRLVGSETCCGTAIMRQQKQIIRHTLPSFPEIKRGVAQLKQAPPSCCLLKEKYYITEHHSHFRAVVLARINRGDTTALCTHSVDTPRREASYVPIESSPELPIPHPPSRCLPTTHPPTRTWPSSACLPATGPAASFPARCRWAARWRARAATTMTTAAAAAVPFLVCCCCWP